MGKPIICLDFDGVCHSYSSGWKGADVIPDPPVDGMWEALFAYQTEFEVHIFSSRTHQPNGTGAMMQWFEDHAKTDEQLAVIRDLHFPTEKPPALWGLDDRVDRFTGRWPSVQYIKEFQPWNREQK